MTIEERLEEIKRILLKMDRRLSDVETMVKDPELVASMLRQKKRSRAIDAEIAAMWRKINKEQSAS